MLYRIKCRIVKFYITATYSSFKEIHFEGKSLNVVSATCDRAADMMTTIICFESNSSRQKYQQNISEKTKHPISIPQDTDPIASAMERIRLVTLDMVGTVIRFRQPPAQQYQAAAARSVTSSRQHDSS